MSTIFEKAKQQIIGFGDLYHKLERDIIINGKSRRTFEAYIGSIASISLHFGRLPFDISDDEIADFLLEVKKSTNYSETYFKFAVYGLRYLFRLYGFDDRKIALPCIPHEKTLPLILSQNECKKLSLPVGFIENLFSKQWVIYAKRPFRSVHNVIEYLGRYTHRVAISNHRITSISDGYVKFWPKNYKTGKKQIIRLSVFEFLSRFCMHILPRKYRKIRHYGFLGNRNKKNKLVRIREDLKSEAPRAPSTDIKTIIIEKYGIDPDICPVCKKGKMQQIIELERGQEYNQLE